MKTVEILEKCGDFRNDCAANVCGECIALGDTSGSENGCKFYRSRNEMSGDEWEFYKCYRNSN